MLFGAHVSIAGGIAQAPINAARLGCECFQIFSRSPCGGSPIELTDKDILEFKNNCRKYNLKNYYIHAPYYINLAAKNNRVYYGSISAIKEELTRGSLLGAEYAMTHLGSAKDFTNRTEAIKLTARALDKILENYAGKTKLLIELSAGAGDIIGADFSEIKKILQTMKLPPKKRPGICLDTAHVFASGYDLRTPKTIDEVLKKFDQELGLKNLKLIHLNDSQADFNSRKDRHANIGEGKIGLNGFSALINHPKLADINCLLETPAGEVEIDNRIREIKLLKSLLKK